MADNHYSAIETERNNRIQKAEELSQKGFEPYSASVRRDYTLQELQEKFESLQGQTVTVAGYIKSIRLSGKIGFATVEDESYPSGFQFLLKADLLENETLSFEDFKQLVDRGDYIQVTGVVDRSQRGEESVFVSSWQMLTKSLRSLPEKLEDIELKYRKRYVDMKLHPETREIFRLKSKFWRYARDYMLQHGFLELQAPTMEHTTGGAEASPFATHHNALDQDFYLRISSELFLKRYIVGGFEKVFDIDKNFRNEGIDDEHLQEYLQLEFYWAYSDFEQLLTYTEDLIKYVIKNTFGTLKLSYRDQSIDWSASWPQMSYYEFVEHFAGISLQEYETLEKLQGLATQLGLNYDETDGYARLVDLIYKKTARPKCISPVWLTDHPVALSPLAKRNPENTELTLRAQLIAYGSELTNGFAELNDPVDQLNRFQEQQQLRESGDDEAMMLDHDFVEALEYGMPPTCGFAFSERLFSILLQKPIRETTAFPLMRREDASQIQKSKSLQVGHSVIYQHEDIPLWAQLNTVAHTSAAFAAHMGEGLFDLQFSKTQDGVIIPMNIADAIIMKSTSSQEILHELYHKAQDQGLEVSVFTKDMQKSSNDKVVNKAHNQKSFSDIIIYGLMIYGEKDTVELLTQDIERYR